MKPVKALTIRLSAEQAHALETVASVEAKPISEVIRAAIEAHIHNRKRDPKFQEGLREQISKTRRLLHRS